MALEHALPREIAIHRTWILDTRPEIVIPSDEYESLLQTDQENDSDLEERCFSALLPLAKKMVSDYKDRIGCLESSPTLTCSSREPYILCALCPGQKALRGWEALILHLKNYWKKRVPQHRAFFHALKEALRTAVESLRQEVSTKSWPPVLIVNSSEDNKLRDMSELKLHEVLAVYSKEGNAADSRIVVAYPASEVGFVDAKQLEARSKNTGESVEQQQQQFQDKEDMEVDNHEDLDDAVAMTRSFCGLVKRSPAGKEADNSGDAAEVYDDDGGSSGDECLSRLFSLLSERQQCELLREKWSKSFEASKQVNLASKPHKKPRNAHQIEDKFQRDLKDLEHLNADGKLRMRFQIEEMEKQLNKERLHLLRSIDHPHSPCRQEVKSARERLSSKVDNDDKDEQEDVLEDRVQCEKRRRYLIAKYQQEQLSLKKQADLAKRERAHLINIFQSSNF